MQTATPQVLGLGTAPARGLASRDPIPEPTLTKPIDFSGLSAQSILVYDVATGTVLAKKAENLRLPIASLTKLLTGLVTYKLLDLSDVVTVTPEGVESTKPSLELAVGEQVKVSDLFNAMLVGSCNDAAKSLAVYAANKTGSDFTTLMNGQADSLGMKQSNFSNPMGFDSDTNYSTALDLQKLVTATRQFTAFTILEKSTSYSFTSVSGQTHLIKATNKLISKDSELFAVKTGNTPEAHGAMITKVVHNGHEFIIIVLGSADREADTLNLKQQIIDAVDWKK